MKLHHCDLNVMCVCVPEKVNECKMYMQQHHHELTHRMLPPNREQQNRPTHRQSPTVLTPSVHSPHHHKTIKTQRGGVKWTAFRLGEKISS